MVRRYGDDYRRLHAPSSAQEAVLRHIADCRTAALGGHLDECTDCGHQRISYNSCRDRHCPKCQSRASSEWVAERVERMLPVPHFHVVFTIPDELNPLALRNPQLVYNLLFEAASQTLLTIARDEKHLGAQIGCTMVLHTWGQRLHLHPHIHAVVTGGGLALDGSRWVSTGDTFFLPVRVLAKLFRGKFLAGLQLAHDEGRLALAGSTAHLAESKAWRRFKSDLYAKNWVVYAKPPFGGTEQVLRYLGRYTHRIAIANHRIVGVADDGRVTFTWKDYAAGCAIKRETVEAVEFLRRFLLHVLPKGFTRIRHYGLCSSTNAKTKLEIARRLLDLAPPSPPAVPPKPPPEPLPWWEVLLAETGVDVMLCPCCGGRLSRRGRLTSAQIERLPARIDSS